MTFTCFIEQKRFDTENTAWHSFSTASISNKHVSAQSHFLLWRKQKPLVSKKVPASVYLSLEIVAHSKMCYALVFDFSEDNYKIATFSQSTLEIWI